MELVTQCALFTGAAVCVRRIARREDFVQQDCPRRLVCRELARATRVCVTRGRRRSVVIHAGVAAGSGTADEFKEAELSSLIAGPQESNLSTRTRNVTITYASTPVCGVFNENDLRRLKSQVEDIDGVGNAWLSPSKEGGVRGGSVTVQIEVEERVPFPALVQSVQALDEALLILPFKLNSWLWRQYFHP